MTMDTRRDFLRTSLFGASARAARPRRAARSAAATRRAAPMRFVFLHRGNGLWPKVMVPPSFDGALMEKERRKEAFTVDLDGHELPEGCSRSRRTSITTLLQGLSGKMCTTGHHSWCSALGVYKANERLAPSGGRPSTSVRRCSVPAEHIELACFPLGGGNARGDLDGIATGFLARGPNNPTTRSARRASRSSTCSSRSPRTPTQANYAPSAACCGSSPRTKATRQAG